MNHWKRVWDVYHRESTKFAYAKELWRLSDWRVRVGLCVAVMILVWGVVDVLQDPRQEWPLPLLIGELLVFAILQHMRDTAFYQAYGSPDGRVSPPESEDQRSSRFMIFKRRLQEASVTKGHIEDLFDVLAAKEDLESQRNMLLNKFLLFVSGFFTALAITLIRNLSIEQAGQVLIWLVAACAILAPIFWLLPSRRGKLKELKYFMVLYCKAS